MDYLLAVSLWILAQTDQLQIVASFTGLTQKRTHKRFPYPSLTNKVREVHLRSALNILVAVIVLAIIIHRD
ncbi:hypothetical protein LguiA_001762 [Lonicera macranthoides]